MALIATVGSATANAFCTRAEATALLSTELDSDVWRAAAEFEQDAALITATRLLGELVDWYGTPTTTTQALPWPMTGLLDRLGRAVLATVVPDDIKRATTLYALELLRTVSLPRPPGLAGIEQLTVGDLSVRLTSPRPATPFERVPPAVRALLAFYGEVTGGPLVRLRRA